MPAEAEVGELEMFSGNVELSFRFFFGFLFQIKNEFEELYLILNSSISIVS